MTGGILDGPSAREYHITQSKKDKKLGLLQQRKISSSSKLPKTKNKENSVSGEKQRGRRKNPMANFPSPTHMRTLGRSESKSIRFLARKEYHDACLVGTIDFASLSQQHPLDHDAGHHSGTVVHHEDEHETPAGIGHDVAALREVKNAPSTPPGSPSPAQGVNPEAISSLKRGHHEELLVPNNELNSSRVGGSRLLTTTPTTPPHAPKLSDSNRDRNLRLFQRLAESRRIVRRQEAILSSNGDDSGERNIEAPKASFLIPTHVQDLVLSIAKLAKGHEVRLVRSAHHAEKVRHKFSEATSATAPTSLDSEQAAIRKGKGKRRATEDVNFEKALQAKSPITPHHTSITSKREGDPNPLSSVLSHALVADKQSSASSVGQNPTCESSNTMRNPPTSPGPSNRYHERALPDADEIETITATVIGILMKREHQWMLLDDVLRVAKGLGYSWNREHLAMAARSHESLLWKEKSGSIYYRYDLSKDDDSTREWGRSRTGKELSALRK